MTMFEFSTVPRIIVENGAAGKIGLILSSTFGNERPILIVTDKGITALGLMKSSLASLADEGFDVSINDSVCADPPEAMVEDAIQNARSLGNPIILGFGGGSSLDTAKIIAASLGSNQPLNEMYGIGNVRAPRLPLVLVPTTAGTGSEVTHISVVTKPNGSKMGIVDPILYADIALLDASLTLGLPRHITAATGIDAMVHAIEAYTSKHKKNPISDMLAKRALSLLGNNILSACNEPTNISARENMILGAMLAGQAFANSPVAGVHALAYPLGEVFHASHGLSNSLVLPHVLRFNADSAQQLYAELSEILIPDVQGSAIEKTTIFIDHLEKLSAATGIEQTLRQIGAKESDLPRLAQDAMVHQRILVNNPKEINEADALSIYSAAF